MTDRQISKKHIIVSNAFFLFVFSLYTIVLCFILFNNLGSNAIADWDEARHGINAYEMVKSNDWIVSTYQYEPDLWNLKPPFSYYLIALSYKVFGFNAFSLRLYSALSLLLVFLTSSYLLYKFCGKISVCVFGILYLSFGEIFFGHCGRTGDADALFLLLYLLAMTSLVFSNRHHWTLYIFGLCFSFAFLTKSFHAVPILLIGIVYIIISKLFIALKLKEYIFLGACLVVPILIWAFFRYFSDGMSFLGSMFGVDVTNRMENGASNGGSYFGFIKALITNRPTQILIAVVFMCYIIKAIINKSIKIRIDYFQIVLVIWFLVTLLFFSLTRTIEFWYYYPTFLCLILLAASMLSNLFLEIINVGISSNKIVFASMCLLAVVFIGISLKNIYGNIQETFQIRTTEAQKAITNFSDNYPNYDSFDCYFIKSKSEDLATLEIKEGIWEQCDVLCAELYGDYKCLNGDVNHFIQNEKSLIFIEKSLMDKYENMLNKVQRYEASDYYVFVH